ncbi:MAG: LLM class flavin-dependent oxidoreductase [Proteobacteria bacterium]|nr:LLM class flavin-dependent oxidoreductase [Pseudomonadota bacterium]
MSNGRQLSLGAMISDVGVHPAAWLDPETPLGGEISFPFYLELARLAEAGKLDFFFMADSLASRTGNMAGIMRQCTYMAHFEPITLMAALASGTTRIGLAATISTTYSEPFNVARMFASLDHISGGRAAYNLVTTANADAAGNFGRDIHEDHAVRYRRGNEFADVLNGLWDSWEDDAFVRDRASGIHFDPAKMHLLNHRGEFLAVRGPLNVPRSPQGRPVAISAGGSDPGRELAARVSEVVFAVDRDLARAQAYYKDLKARMARHGRAPDDLKVMAALNPFIGETDQEAHDLLGALQARIHPDVGRAILSVDLDVDLRGLPVDEPIPASVLPPGTNATKSYFDKMVEAMGERPMTLRELYEANAASRGGMNAVVGSPKTIADRMEEWFTNGAADGFMVRLPTVPGSLERFVRLVVPELQRRGLFRTEYGGTTLRDHLGLARPPGRRG